MVSVTKIAFKKIAAKKTAVCLGMSLVALTAAASVAEAQSSRGPLRVTVQKRSYFDAGNVVPVGSLNRYASQHIGASPVYANTAEFFGDATLPGRVGAGRNPYAATIETPRY